MPPFIPLLVNFGVALTLLAAGVILLARRSERLPPRSGLLAVFPLLDAAVLVAFVFGEDSYRGNGVSRWEAYRSPGGALGYMFALSIALMTICAALLVYWGSGVEKQSFLRTAFTGGLAALLLIIPTVVGFSAN